MSFTVAPAKDKNRRFGAGPWGRALIAAIHWVLALLGLAIFVQALIVVEARPQT
jgi:hypothetical protein